MNNWHWLISIYIFNLEAKDQYMLPWKVLDDQRSGGDENDNISGGFTVIKN